MNKKTIVSVLVFLLAIIGIWHFANKPTTQIAENQTNPATKTDLEAKSISSAYIYGPDLNKVKVYLYAPDEKKTVIESSYCGGIKGSEVRSGNYELILDPTNTKFLAP